MPVLSVAGERFGERDTQTHTRTALAIGFTGDALASAATAYSAERDPRGRFQSSNRESVAIQMATLDLSRTIF
jgi:hypothetical protein